MELSLPNLGSWKNLRFPAGMEFRYKKYLDRAANIKRTWHWLSKYMPEYLSASTASVVDFGAGSGIALEMFRHFGYRTLAVDFYRSPEADFSPFLESQGITLLRHDCREFPYPLADNSFAVATCISAIDCMAEALGFVRVMDEFARIATHVIFVVVNKDSHQFALDGGKEILDNWTHPLFHRVHTDVDHVYKWVAPQRR